jgi:hypothetical protein
VLLVNTYNIIGGFICLVLGFVVLALHRQLARLYFVVFGSVLTSRPLPMSRSGANRFLRLTLLLVGIMLLIGGVGLLIAD